MPSGGTLCGSAHIRHEPRRRRSHLDLVSASVEAAVAQRDATAYQRLRPMLLNAQRNLQELSGGSMPRQSRGVEAFIPAAVAARRSANCNRNLPDCCPERPLCAGLSRFPHALGHRSSLVSDTLDEQPLSGRGLEQFAALEVWNSTWIERLRATCDDDSYWLTMHHYALCFKDCLVEVIAKRMQWLSEAKPAEQWIAEAVQGSVQLASWNGIQRTILINLHMTSSEERCPSFRKFSTSKRHVIAPRKFFGATLFTLEVVIIS